MKTNNKQIHDTNSWLNEAEKKQERKQSKLMRELKRNRKTQWMVE